MADADVRRTSKVFLLGLVDYIPKSFYIEQN